MILSAFSSTIIISRQQRLGFGSDIFGEDRRILGEILPAEKDHSAPDKARSRNKNNTTHSVDRWSGRSSVRRADESV